MAKSYTGKGDDGTTGRFRGDRISKSSAIPAILGTIDETNAALGVAKSTLLKHQSDMNSLNDADRYTLHGWIEALQHLLFRCGADLSTPMDKEPAAPRISNQDLKTLEASIDGLDAILPDLSAFILPGGTTCGAVLHQARATVRRAERMAVAAQEDGETFNKDLLPYLNRFSSYLFALARWVNWRAGIIEEHPNYGMSEKSGSPSTPDSAGTTETKKATPDKSADEGEVK